jgi:hypothetical protein
VQKVILYLIGYGGSGKSSAAAYLQATYGFAPFAFSSVIRDYASKNGIALKKRADYANAHAEMLARYGWDYTVGAGLDMPSDRICIDDVRTRKYAERIKQAGGVSIAFDCPTEIRFAHVRDHADRVKYPATLDAFVQNECDDEKATIGTGLEFETAALMESADYHVDASKRLVDTFRQLDAIITQL